MAKNLMISEDVIARLSRETMLAISETARNLAERRGPTLLQIRTLIDYLSIGSWPIDYRCNRPLRDGEQLICRKTGEDLAAKLPIVAADPNIGTLLVLVKDENGIMAIDLDTRRPVIQGVSRDFDLVPFRETRGILWGSGRTSPETLRRDQAELERQATIPESRVKVEGDEL